MSATAFEVARRMSENEAVLLVDVRTPAEFEHVHAQGATNVPLDRLDPAKVMSDGNSRAVYLICKSGTRAEKAREKLARAGCSDAVCVEGGTDAWVHCGLPVVRGRTTISLERQVRIAAGSLVAAGIALGALVNPWCYAISAFVGCGLVFSGITDTCGMGMILARMPWNR
ncbi:MAG: rhodanese-like domain-containing protein [Tepidisphaeraceae bacterium]